MIPQWFIVGSLIVMVAILLTDLALVRKRPHIPSAAECIAWVAFYVSLALVFAGALYLLADRTTAGQFLAGWVTEYSLSVDNLFVFLIIMSKFAVPKKEQQLVLMVGIIISLVLRGGFILAGSAVLERFGWVFYLFGIFLIYTAVKVVIDRNAEEEYQESKLIALIRRAGRVHDHYDGPRVRTTVDGKRFFTPMILVFVAIGTTDLLFALDSIPAIFGLTTDPFIVFSATIFALMGLRQLYFLLGGLLDRLVYLPFGLAAILGFIGVKLIFEALGTNTLRFINGGHGVAWVPEFSTELSLAVILGVLAVTALASVVKARVDEARLDNR
ncbi:TerC family protein [Rarobacter faecitabidus]|uniref:Tellurite resistance protein TerC n=1 Tax=Rarobacter faecitabidus TaxID=13243 RepID=A0A542ZVX5_RARFA|nr:TerC family protein [Rarobacter faecitabidus]TQL64514.1 tellurite resistance protein TerC [Rarobacter faecitabidus]